MATTPRLMESVIRLPVGKDAIFRAIQGAGDGLYDGFRGHVIRAVVNYAVGFHGARGNEDRLDLGRNPLLKFHPVDFVEGASRRLGGKGQCREEEQSEAGHSPK